MKKFFLLALFLLPGCATYATFSETTHILAEGIPYKSKITVSKLYHGQKNYNNLDGLKSKLTDYMRYEESLHGFASSDNPVIEIEMSVESDHTDCLPCSFVTGLSLFVIPSWETIRVKMDVTARNLKTKKTLQFTETGKYTTYYHLLALLAVWRTQVAGENELFAEMMGNVFNRVALELKN